MFWKTGEVDIFVCFLFLNKVWTWLPWLMNGNFLSLCKYFLVGILPIMILNSQDTFISQQHLVSFIYFF